MDYDTYIEEVTDKGENLEEDGWFSTIFKKRKLSSVENEIKRYLLEDVADRKKPVRVMAFEKRNISKSGLYG